MVLRMSGVAVIGTADAVLETPEGRPIPPEDQTKTVVCCTGPIRVARHRAVKAGRVRLRHLTDLANIRVCAQLAVEEKRLRSVEKEKREVQLQTLKQEIRSYQTLQQQITEESRILYEAYAMDGSMSRTEYADKKAALLARREKACEDEAAAKQRLESLWNGESKFIEKYKGLTDLDKLTAELAADLLRFIKIWPDGRVNVELNYLDEIPHAVVRNLLAAI